MKKNILFLFLLMFCMSLLLPELQQAFALDVCQDGDCLMAAGMAFAPLKWELGRNNMGGYKGHALFIPEDAVAAAPLVPDPKTATNNTDGVTAKGSFSFVEGSTVKAPLYMYSTEGEVEYKAEQQGEADGISYKCTLTLFFPGSTPELHAFAALVKNTRGYYIFEDVDGQQFLLGQPGLCCTTAPSFNGGKARSDRRGMTFTITCDSNYSAILMGTPVDIRQIGGYKAVEEP